MRPFTKFVFAACVGLVLTLFFSSASYAQSGAPDTSSGAHYAAPIGKIETLTGTVKIEHTSGVVVQASASPDGGAKVGDAVYQGDQVTTGANSKVGIAFTDGTAFNLSSNAHMVLDKYIYDPNGQSNASLFSMTKGAFTFIAGKVARTGDMKVNTPVATMGIRGTAPHVEISEDGKVKFSTLIEESKNSAQDFPKGGVRNKASLQVPVKKAQAQGKDIRMQAEREYDKRLNICNGC